MWELHAVIISKVIPLEKAKKMAQDIIKDKSKTYYRETEESYRFRNIPKTKFKAFRSIIINLNLTLIYGEMK